MRASDFDRPAFRERYPEAKLVRIVAKKSRRRSYVIDIGARSLIMCVTDLGSAANLTEASVAQTLSLHGVPVAPIVDSFEGSGARFLIQEFRDGDSLDDRLRSADEPGSHRLGTIMGSLLDKLHALPVDDFAGLPAPRGSWWDWLKDLQRELPIPADLTRTEPSLCFVHNDFLPHNILLATGSEQILALIDFEWSFVGDPCWDLGYLRHWLRTGDYPHTEDCVAGIETSYQHQVDDAPAAFYASIRSPDDLRWWRDGTPPPVAWL